MEEHASNKKDINNHLANYSSYQKFTPIGQQFVQYSQIFMLFQFKTTPSSYILPKSHHIMLKKALCIKEINEVHQQLKSTERIAII